MDDDYNSWITQNMNSYELLNNNFVPEIWNSRNAMAEERVNLLQQYAIRNAEMASNPNLIIRLNGDVTPLVDTTLEVIQQQIIEDTRNSLDSYIGQPVSSTDPVIEHFVNREKKQKELMNAYDTIAEQMKAGDVNLADVVRSIKRRCDLGDVETDAPGLSEFYEEL